MEAYGVAEARLEVRGQFHVWYPLNSRLVAPGACLHGVDKAYMSASQLIEPQLFGHPPQSRLWAYRSVHFKQLYQ